MNHEDWNANDIYKNHNPNDSVPLIGVSTIIGNDVCNPDGEDLGTIKEVMLDTTNGKVCYAVLSFGGIFGIGNKLFAVPWHALKLDAEKKHFVLNMDKDRLNYMSGFDKDNWPDITTCF